MLWTAAPSVPLQSSRNAPIPTYGGSKCTPSKAPLATFTSVNQGAGSINSSVGIPSEFVEQRPGGLDLLVSASFFAIA